MNKQLKINRKRVGNTISRLKNEGAFAVMGGSFFMKVAGFLGSIVLVRVVSKNDYGILTHIENIYNYAYIFAGLGLNYAVFRYVVLASNEIEKRSILNYALKSGLCINILICAIASLAGMIMERSNTFDGTRVLLPLMLIALPFQYSFETGQFTLRALFNNNRYALYAVMSTILIWLSKVLGAILYSIPGAVSAWPIAYVISAIVVLLYLVKKPLVVEHTKTLSLDLKREMHIYAFQYMVTNGLWALFMQNDLLIISSLTDNASLVAEYKVAYAIPAALAILSSSVGIFVAPYFVRREKDHDWVWNHYIKVLVGTACLVSLASIIISMLSKIIILTMYGNQYMNIAPLMNLLLVVAIINNGIRYPTANLFASMGVIRYNMITAIVGMLIQIILDYILIPKYGLFGAAYASIAVYTVMSIGVIVPFVIRYRN